MPVSKFEHNYNNEFIQNLIKNSEKLIQKAIKREKYDKVWEMIKKNKKW